MSDRRKRVFKRPQGPDTTPQDVDEEVRFHIEKKVEWLMAGGLEEAEARREALRRFGDMEEVKAAMTREQRAGARNGITGQFWDRMRARHPLRGASVDQGSGIHPSDGPDTGSGDRVYDGNLLGRRRCPPPPPSLPGT